MEREVSEGEMRELWGDGSAFGLPPNTTLVDPELARKVAFSFASAIAKKQWERGYTDAKGESSIGIGLLVSATSAGWERGYMDAKGESSIGIGLLVSATSAGWERGYGEGFDKGFYKAVGIKDGQI